MILTHKTKNEFIYSYFEFHIVDKNGHLANDGNYMYVADIWVHPRFDGKKEISRYIKELNKMKENRDIKHIYWQRTKGENFKRLSRALSRETCLRRAG